MVTGRDSGTSGAFYLDGFVSRRATYIGSQSTGQMAVGPAFDLAAKSYHRPVRLAGLEDRAAAGLAAPLADISGTVLVTTTIGYHYDGLGRLTAARYSDGRFFEYTYDSTGNRLSETKPTGAVTYTYDVANRLLTAGAQAYVWDAAGNLITDGAITYTYDSAQRLIGLQSTGNTSSYVYNGLGDRVQQPVNGATTNYALDLNTGLTQVLADNGTVYLYGADRLGEQQVGGWQYHHADGLGSLRALTNGSATVTLSKRYAPYGDVLDMAGTDASIFGYTGEQQNEGLVYLRARYYASGLGRFVSRDTWPGEYNRGLSLNRWSYTENSPVNYTDPSGLVPCADDQPNRLCILTNGGYLDYRHFVEQRSQALSLMQSDLPALFGKNPGVLKLSGQLGDGVPDFARSATMYRATYYTKFPKTGFLPAQLGSIALGIMMHYDMGFETAQGIDPRCWTILAYQGIGGGLGHCSSFSNEDLPSNYLAIVSAIKGYNFADIVSILGGGEQSDEPPSEYWGGAHSSTMCIAGYCALDNPANHLCQLKVFDPETKQFAMRAWPPELIIAPTGYGVFWSDRYFDIVKDERTTPRPAPTPKTPNDIIAR